MGAKTLITAEQLYDLAGDRRVELVRGELLETAPVGFEHGQVVVLFGSWLLAFVRERKLGAVATELGCILSRKPDVVRAPDICFISAGRIGARDGFFEGAPDLAVEVVSPGDKVSEMQEKIREYLAAGTRLVWLVDPHSQTVTAHRPSGDAHVFAGDDDVTGEDVLPGFQFRPSDLFRQD